MYISIYILNGRDSQKTNYFKRPHTAKRSATEMSFVFKYMRPNAIVAPAEVTSILTCGPSKIREQLLVPDPSPPPCSDLRSCPLTPILNGNETIFEKQK